VSRSLVEAAGHELTVELPETPVWLDADLTRLAQVVSNLVNNAAKYTPDGGRIRVMARRGGARRSSPLPTPGSASRTYAPQGVGDVRPG